MVRESRIKHHTHTVTHTHTHAVTHAHTYTEHTETAAGLGTGLGNSSEVAGLIAKWGISTCTLEPGTKPKLLHNKTSAA